MTTVQLSDHFTLDEATASQTASRKGIANVPSEVILANMYKTAKCMERLRALLQFPISISSWYRSPALNFEVGGVSTSQHLTGEAVDFNCFNYGPPVEVCKRILAFPELITFDQLILEHTWVHISFNANPSVPNRRQVLSLLQSGHYANGLTDKWGNPL